MEENPMVKKVKIIKAMLSGLLLAVLYITNLFASELNVEVIFAGEGTPIQKGMLASVHYEGRLESGEIFDKSNRNGAPFSFVLGAGQVIQGWEKGIQGMRVGEKRLLTIPPQLAYGANGAGGIIPPNATLIFEV